MIRPGVVSGIARAEARLSRRLVRYWVFLVGSYGIGFLIFSWYMLIHVNFSTFSATAALINPRFLVPYVGLWYLTAFLLVLILLGYDVRARDTRERIVEVLDASPCTNLELLLGRYIGIIFAVWVPAAFAAMLFGLIGWLVGSPIQLQSLIGFVTVMALPAFAFVLGLSFLVTVLVRNRLIAAVLLFAIVIGLVVSNVFLVPVYMLPLVDVTGALSLPYQSDLVPKILDGHAFWQRSGFLLVGLAFLCFAAALYPRRDDIPRGRLAAFGALLFIAGQALGWGQVSSYRSYVGDRAAYRAAHEARAGEPAPDLQRITGEVTIERGGELSAELTLTVAAPPRLPLDRAIFTLNPGLRIDGVADASGQTLEHEFENGLLEIVLPRTLQPGAELDLRLSFAGSPEMNFAFLDGAIEPLEVNIQDGNIFLLGFLPSILEKRSVVLLPEIRWLPESGVEIGRGDPEIRPTDFFAIDLTVEIPDGWLVAGPGKRQSAAAGSSGGTAFRFAPPAPVPGVALVAGRFESRSTEIDGVTLEVLVHPKHTANLEVLAPAAERIEEKLTERLREASEIGLAYPYDGLTLVEVTGGLRSFGGGWRMDSTFIQPGMILMRESGFPTARFDRRFDDPSEFEEQEGGYPQAVVDALEQFFETDFSGGNPFVAAARNFFGFQTSAAGDDGLPLDYVLENLTTRLVTDRQGYFSVHMFDSDVGNSIGQAMGAIFSNQGSNVADVIIDALTSRSEVWESVTTVSLGNLDPWDEPGRTVDVLTLKGGAMARSLLDGWGREKVGQLIGTLRESYEGANYSLDDVVAIGRELDEDLEPWFDVWLHQVDLPGFTSGAVELLRIVDDDDGAPRYQLLVAVHNEEATPGLLRVEYRTDSQHRDAPWQQSEPILVPGGSGVEIGVVSSSPVTSARVAPYLALNRNRFDLTLPHLDTEELADAEPVTGARVFPWEPVETEAVVIDDLDPGFSVLEDEARGWRIGGGSTAVDTDNGLPVTLPGQRPSQWSREALTDAWGKYRHTAAVVTTGSGKRKAIFAADVPRGGRWQLEYHVPGRYAGESARNRALQDLTLVVEGQEVTLDLKGGDPGWTEVGTFDLARGEVTVDVLDKSEGGYIVADAVRWTPMTGDRAESGVQ